MGACPWRFESSLRHQLLIPEDPRQRSTGGLALGAAGFAGLGPLLRSELHRIGASGISVSRIRNHDYVSFRLDSANLRSLRSLRLAEDLFLEIAVAKQIERPSDIRSLSGRLNKQVTLEAISLKNLLFPARQARKPKRPTYVCFVRQHRDHRVSRRRVSERMELSIRNAFPRWRLSDPADLEFWVFWSGCATLSLRLSDETFKYRGRPPPRRVAALRPTIAAAMIELAKLDVAHVVLDPMCGTGTLLLEPSLRYPNARFLGSDKSAEATALATRRLEGRARIRQCELGRLDYEPGSFDRIVSNLPWGKQFEVEDALYTEGVARLSDWIVDDGIVVLLTPRRDLLESTLRRLRAKWITTSVLVQGTWASIHVARKGKKNPPDRAPVRSRQRHVPVDGHK